MQTINGCPVVHEIGTLRLAYGEYENVYMIWSGYFADKQPAFQFVQVRPKGALEVISNVNVNLEAYGMVPPEGHIFVPDYSQHSGKPLALELAGVAEIVEYIKIGFGEGCLMKLTVDLPEMPSAEEIVPKH